MLHKVPVLRVKPWQQIRQPIEVLMHVAVDHADSPRGEFRETVTLAVPRPGPSYQVICQIDAPRAIRAHGWSADAQPLHATSTGKLVLAELARSELNAAIRQGLTRHTAATIVQPDALRSELEQVRHQGWAQMVDELEDGLTGISVPLRDHQRTLTAAIGITAPSQRMGPDQRQDAVDALMASASRGYNAPGMDRPGRRPAERGCDVSVRRAQPVLRWLDAGGVGFDLDAVGVDGRHLAAQR